MKTLKIKDELHKDLKDYCNSKGLKMNIFVELIIMEYLKKEHKDDNR